MTTFLIVEFDGYEFPVALFDTARECACWLGCSVREVYYSCCDGCVVSGRYRVLKINL